jgi:hypothetical protein
MKKLLLFTTLLVATVNYSQNVPNSSTSNPNKIKVYTPSSTISSNGKPTDNGYKWVVKTDLLAALVGEFPIIAEYKIGKKFSVEGSVAVTNAFLPNDLTFAVDGSSDYDSKAAIGTAFRGTLKFYPSSDYDAIEGWSFGIQLFTKTTNREYTGDSTYPELEGKIDSKTKTGVSLIISKQIFADSNIAFESFIGVGMANISHEYYTSTYNSTLEINQYTPFKSSESSPNFQLGFRIGFGN